jgi:hypothetical protein
MYSFSDIADPPDTNGHMLANIISISCLRYYGRGVPRFSRSILHFPEFDSSQPIGSTVTLIDAEMRRAEGGGGVARHLRYSGYLGNHFANVWYK